MTLHLVPLLAPGGLLVPEQITVSACLADMRKEFAFVAADGTVVEDRQRVELGPMFDLNQEAARDPQTLVAPRTVPVPDALPPGFQTFLLRTTITTFGTLTLADYDYGLTYPTIIDAVGKISPGTAVTATYQLGDRPGFVIRRQEALPPHD
ncbi:MAG TPA: hypothetical protein VGE07_05985 [Herpetosiphonaceae bacterium]